MIDLKRYEFWLATGSQDLYGKETLDQVDKDSRIIADALDAALPCRVIWKPVLTSSSAILSLAREANANPACAGIITWMHTFSPSKMWIAGLSELRRPLCHLHTQYNRDIPWEGIDMDFMNLNQSAHGDREHGYIGARMRLARKVLVGHWKDEALQARLGRWMRAAAAFADGRSLCVARFGDNMREVAVTEGDKVEAQIRFGWSVNGYGISELARSIESVPDSDVKRLIDEYRESYEMPRDQSPQESARIAEQARIELGLEAFLSRGSGNVGAIGGFGAFTTTFEDLSGLAQLPGLAAQRLMAKGIGFGAEGDWKTAALVRAMKVMATGLPGGTSFMEDYTYHFEPGKEAVLGAHMLEVCPSVAAAKPRLEVHPLGIGGKADPARLVFDGAPGPAVNATIIDLGDRFRMICNEVDAIAAANPMPKLPVARVLWRPRPNLYEAAESWIIAGGAHHTGYSTAIGMEELRDYANIAGIEFVNIGAKSDPEDIRKELFWNEAAFKAAAR